MIPKTFEKVREDGKVQKHVIKAAPEGAEGFPAKGQLAEILYKCRKSDYSVIDENENSEDPFEFEVASNSVIKGLNVGVVTMRKGERAVFKIDPELAYGAAGAGKITPNETIYFEAELVDFFDKKKTKLDFSPEERLEKAKVLKEEGNQLFGQGKLAEATAKYEEALDFIDWEKLSEVPQLKVSMRNNLALISLKQGKYREVVRNCILALELDKKNVKALFRRAKAKRLLQEFESAEEDLRMAVEIAPEDEEIKSELVQLKKDWKAFESKQKGMYSNMFSKGPLYNDLPKKDSDDEDEDTEEKPVTKEFEETLEDKMRAIPESKTKKDQEEEEK